MKLGENIYTYRRENGLSQEELAERLEVSRQSVSKWETDTAVPELDKLLRMCEIFDISLDELVGRKTAEEAPSVPVTTPPTAERMFQKILGLILIVFSLLGRILILLLPLPPNGEGLYVLLPFSLSIFVCGILCLVLKSHVGYWCTWAILSPITLLTPHVAGLPVLGAIGVAQLFAFAAMSVWCAKSFAPLPSQGKGKKVVLITACALCLLCYVAVLLFAPSYPLFLFLNFPLYAALALLLTCTVRYV